ncbi:cobaltochelatase subunit CobN [Maricurvus nonylphenolicus]|uniref:cobaltochelatase subunit CobN n=1 Tax=Maricurvus nonylphenolicus TaxID=1008307 RepID=UPI0036F248A2
MNRKRKYLNRLSALGIALTLSFSAMLSTTAQAADEKVLFVSAAHSNKAKVSLLKENTAATGVVVEQKTEKSIGDLSKAATLFAEYDLVVLDGVSKRESKKTYEKYIPLVNSIVKQGQTKFLAINWLEQPELVKGVTGEQAKLLHDYYSNGGVQNIQRMLDYLSYRVFSQDNSREVEAPIIYPDLGIYHPQAEQLVFDSLDKYLSWKLQGAEQPQKVIGVLLQRSLIESAQTQVIDSAIAQLEQKGALVVPFFFELSPFSSDYTHLISKDGKTFVDVIVNFRNIHWAAKRKQEFEKLGVPVLQGLTYFDGDQQAWEADNQGISPNMTPFTLVLPEGAGVIDPTIVAAINEETGRAEVIDYQLEYLLNKALNHAELKHKPNADKRMTIMVWGSIDVGASFLNVPDSLRSISDRLYAEGYGVNKVNNDYYVDRIKPILEPFYREFELQNLLEQDLAELMPVEDYLAWFNTLPNDVTAPINEFWGPAEKGFMTVKRDGKSFFVIPRMRNGNMLVMRQPPRSDDKDQEAMLYHKGTVPMNHFYLAAYFYSRTYWNSDAIIHLGTHGSQEYLSGKERGLSKYDQGNLAVWETPVLYPFIVDDVGEAMQTKRRGSATVFGHMTPPFAAAGLQGDVADLHELMHQYKSLDEGGVKDKTGQQIVDDCIANNICDDFGWEQAQIDEDFDGFLEVLHDYMEDLSSQNQPLGLHSYGELAENDLLIATLLQMISKSFPAQIAAFEREHFEAEAHDHTHGHDHEHDKKHDHSNSHDEYAHHAAEDGGDFEGVITQVTGDELDQLVGYKTVRAFVVDKTATEEELDDVGLDEAVITELRKAQKYYANLLAIKELDHLVMGLSGQYVPVKNGGDPVRSPDSIPTGFNLYGFDPARVPTKAAFEQGKELADGVINDYYKQHGKFPDKLAFSLWSIETMRHYGVLESQALYAMGVKPVWSDDGRVIGTEIIPASELKRPRVDVVLSATGLYRDAFPNVMQRLAKAIESVAKLKEDNNSIWDNSQRIAKELKEQGVEGEEAEYLSTVRIFSNSSGNYGSGVSDPVFASDTWEDDSKIADNYLSTMGYYYGSDNSRWGKKVGTVTGADGVEREVNLYAEQLSGTDVALFSRSSNVYGMITSDDPFEYFGSLALAVRNIDGESPQMMISNLRDANNPKAENAASFMAKELRSRNFHKRWVEEMMKEGYSGATTMASNLENFWGWNVVDPNIVRDDQWQEFFEVYVEDKLEVGINEFFEEMNPQSQANMLSRMLEANRKDYWQADAETLQQILQKFAELTNKHDLFVDNEKLREYFEQQSAGFGLDLSLPTVDPTAALPASQQASEPQQAQTEQVEGQQLEKVEETATADSEWNIPLLSTLLASLFIFLAGVAVQLRPRQVQVAPGY